MPSARSRSVGQGSRGLESRWWGVSPVMVLTSLLWRLWKWLCRLATGKCEIQRFAESKEPLTTRTINIEKSIRNSRNEAVRSIAEDSSVSVEQALEILAKAKGVKNIPSVVERLQLSLVRVHSLTLLWEELDSLALQPFSPENKEHEQTLLEVWELLMPGTELESRHTKQWQEIGFQGKDPATDFRGMGILGLYCLHYFASHHQSLARSVLSRSHHPQHHYPYAVVGIHMIEMVHGWLRDSKLRSYLYHTCQDWPLSMDELMEIYCYLFYKFDQFWEQKRPENVMAFVPIKEQFRTHYEDLLSETPPPFTMRV